jgi:hypothetical protein
VDSGVQHPPQTSLTNNAINPPAYGQVQRQAAAAVVDSLAEKICEQITALRKQLDDIENIVLQGSAQAKHMLEEQILLCTHLSDEVRHSQDVIAELKERATAGRD